MEADPKDLGTAARATTPVLLIPGCYVFHINCCWTQVNLYLLNMQCLAVDSPVSRSFLGVFICLVCCKFIYFPAYLHVIRLLVPSSVLPTRSCPVKGQGKYWELWFAACFELNSFSWYSSAWWKEGIFLLISCACVLKGAAVMSYSLKIESN